MISTARCVSLRCGARSVEHGVECGLADGSESGRLLLSVSVSCVGRVHRGSSREIDRGSEVRATADTETCRRADGVRVSESRAARCSSV